MSKASDRLTQAVQEALDWVKTLSPEDAEKMWAAQRASYVRSITDWPKPRFEWINGVKVYASFEDYCND